MKLTWWWQRNLLLLSMLQGCVNMLADYYALHLIMTLQHHWNCNTCMKFFPIPLSSNKEMIMGLAPYGDRPTFSLSVNHYQTYTGITDKDRALTISEMAKIFNVENKQKKFCILF